MLRTVLKSKIHRAAVTEANLNYEGSITIDRELMDAARLSAFEQVHVWDVTSGSRLVTYAIEAPRHSGTICINGAAAHLVKDGDLVIIASFVALDEAELASHQPNIVFVDSKNRIKKIGDAA